ncbi:hypothetical protein A0J57_19445 [Sphingobium sp. 22B]|nr:MULTISPECIES: hypothetical protein [Sphingobium]KXU30823.1 hypothetical protein AXW74_15675 [Sphingobium sp. AM]KYC30650.1 hypothetical protein A0J57_19445 [Sphingobium sp. 22B]OAP30371.1 hypothetical protein A8O16_18750 [Sphingobium sp. 20006FA]KKW89340.1 hypothetical protein YP76_25785 [Sphingobium chungbukense]PNQ02562.1 hypothetical protein A8G00_13300 [Sphingobium sp. SA916]
MKNVGSNISLLEAAVLKIDLNTYGMTQDSPACPIVHMTQDEFDPLQPNQIGDGDETTAQRIGYAIAYLIAFSCVAYFIYI